MPKFKTGFAFLAPPVILSVVALVGWALDIPLLASGIVSSVRMNPATALCFILLSLEASLLMAENNSPFASRAGKCAVWLVIIACAMRSSDYMLGTTFGIDTQLFSAKLDIAGITQPNRMAPLTTVCFLALSFSLLFLGSAHILISKALATSALVVTLAPMTGYLSDIEALYRHGLAIPMAFNTATSFIFLSVAVLWISPDKEFMPFFASIDKRTSLYTQIFFWFLLITLIPLGMVGFYTYQFANTAIQNEMHRFLEGYADKQRDSIDRYMQERLEDAQVFSKTPGLKEILQKNEETFLKGGLASPVYIEQTNEFLPFAKKIVKTYDYINLYLISINGNVIFGVNPGTLLGTNLFSGLLEDSELSRTVKMALESKAPQMSKFDFYPGLNGEEAAYLVAPIFHGEKVIGILTLRINPDNIYKIVKDITGLGETGESILGLKIGDEIVFVADTRHIQNSAHKFRAKIGLSNALPMQNAVLEQNGSGYAIDYRGQPVWAVWRYLPSIKMGLVVKMDTKEISFRTAPIRNFALVVFLLAFALVFFITRRIAKSIAKPIEQLTASTQVIANGQFHQRVEIRETNEIGALANAFNLMASKLEDSYAKINSIVASANDGIITIHDNGRVESFNPGAERIFGYAADEVIGKNISMLMPEPYRAEHDGYIKNYLRTGQSKVVGLTLEVTGLRKNGDRFFMELSVSKILLGTQLLFAGIIRDITERRQATEEIQKLSYAIEQSPISVVITDADGNIEYVNHKFMEVTGYARTEAIGQNPRILKSGSQSEELYQEMWRKISSGETWRGELCNKRKNGETYWEKVAISPIKNETGVITHYIGLKEDITALKLTEDNLKIADERWRLAIEGASDGLWDWNIKTGEVYFSPSLMTMIGYEPFELEGHVSSWEKLIHPDEAPLVTEALRLFLEGKTLSYETEHRLRTKSGGWKWILDRGKIFARDANGEPLRAVGTHTDISARKRNEEEIQKLSHAVEQSLSPIMITDRRGIIEYVNPKFEELTGYHAVEAIGKKSSILKSGTHPPEFYKNLWGTILSGKEFRSDFCNRKKNGELFWELQSISPIFDSTGGIKNFISISIDSTERKIAEEALRKSEERLRQHREHLQEMVETRTRQLTLENMDRRQAEESLARALREQDSIFSANPDIIYVADLQACLLKWNKSLETVTGFSSEELMMKKWTSLVPPGETDLVTAAFAKMLSEGKGEVEIHLLGKSGALIPYHFNGVPLRNQQGQIVGSTGTGRDITERKQAEERVKKIYEQLVHSEKLSALGKLTGSIAHEFNNPIYGLRNIVEQTSEEEGLDPEIKELLALALRECDRMAGMVRKLQGFYKPSDDTKTLVDIHQALNDIEALTRKKMQIKGIKLVKNYSPDLPGIYIVEDQVKQVLLNLINNAEEAIPEGNGKITITTEFNDSYVKVHVQDTGEGIPEENLKLIFDPFFSTKGIKGTGLGLSVCYGLVNAQGGDITVVSKPGEGSTFTLSLPIL